MRHNQSALSPPPSSRLSRNLKTITRTGQALGFLDAMNLIARLSTSTGHPVEVETIDRIYLTLQRGYSERFKRGIA